jgi:hypothetical protein
MPEVTIENGKLKVSMDINKTPVKSKTGKTLIVASTHGNQKVEIDGKFYYIGINCYCYPD